MAYMRPAIGKTLRFIAKAGFWIVGFVGFILAMTVVNEKTGFVGFVVAFIVAPVTFAAVSWYLWIARGNPALLILNYGGMFFAFFLQWLGDKIGPKPLWEQR
jgi:preprotein translocase subunit Sss1